MAGQPADHLTAPRPHEGDDLAVRLGERVHRRRRALGRTLADVAREAEVSVSYLSAIEHGTNLPSLPVLGRLVHALRLTMHELLKEEERHLVRAGHLDDTVPGPEDLGHPALRLRVAALVGRPGESGLAPLPVAGATVVVFVERGALSVEVDGLTYALGQGDALDAIEVGDMRWQTLGETSSVSLWGASAPGGTVPRPSPDSA